MTVWEARLLPQGFLVKNISLHDIFISGYRFDSVSHTLGVEMKKFRNDGLFGHKFSEVFNIHAPSGFFCILHYE